MGRTPKEEEERTKEILSGLRKECPECYALGLQTDLFCESCCYDFGQDAQYNRVRIISPN